VSGGKPIYLVGMMGVGKSTVGALLADMLGRVFVDSDLEIERTTGRSVSEIFEQEGEARFRELERAAIDEAFERRPSAVIALGGGAIVQPGMLDRLKERGVIVYLRARPEALDDRIGDGTSRPLLAGLSDEARVVRLTALLEARRPFYEQADHRIDAEGDAAEVALRIRDVLRRRATEDRK
jgi:shikimate kinase